jgi:WD40 repeat protein
MGIKRWLRRDEKTLPGQADAGGTREAVAALIKSMLEHNSPEIVRALAVFADQTTDDHMRQVLFDDLAELNDQPSRDAVCGVWAPGRNQRLGEFLMKARWVASQPPLLRALTALYQGLGETLVNEGADVVEPLLILSNDGQPSIAQGARSVLGQLKSLEAREQLCRIAVEQDNALAREIAVSAGFVPRDLHARVVFFILTGQWEEYQKIDFDASLLDSIYRLTANEQIRLRIAEALQQSGRVELLQIAAVGRKRLRIGDMSDWEWAAIIQALKRDGRYEQLWSLAQVGPAIKSAAILKFLDSRNWRPATDLEAQAFGQIVLLAKALSTERPVLGSLARRTCHISGHREQINHAVFTPDAKLLITTSADDTVRIWRMPNATCEAVLEEHHSNVHGVAVSPDGSLLASYAANNTLCLWSLPEGKLIRTLITDGVAFNLAFASNGRVLIGQGSTVVGRTSVDNVCLWAVPEGKVIKVFPRGVGFAVSPAQNTVAIVAQPDTVTKHDDPASLSLWSADSGTQLATVQDPLRVGKDNRGRLPLLLTPNGQWLVSNGVGLWSVPDGKPIRTLRERCQVIAVSPSSRLLACAGSDEEKRAYRHTPREAIVDIISMPDGRLLNSIRLGMKHEVFQLAFLPDESTLLVRLIGLEGLSLKTYPKTYLIDIVAGSKLTDFDRINSAFLSPDGCFAAVTNLTVTAELWASELHSISNLPISRTLASHLASIETTLAQEGLSANERSWLEFLAGLLRLKHRYDIGLDEATDHLSFGQFDIELSA